VFSEILSDPAVREASNHVVTIIIRRPHAYAFASRYPRSPIPGIVILKDDGSLKHAFADGSAAELVRMLR
jgi:hypothetical protein